MDAVIAEAVAGVRAVHQRERDAWAAERALLLQQRAALEARCHALERELTCAHEDLTVSLAVAAAATASHAVNDAPQDAGASFPGFMFPREAPDAAPEPVSAALPQQLTRKKPVPLSRASDAPDAAGAPASAAPPAERTEEVPSDTLEMLWPLPSAAAPSPLSSATSFPAGEPMQRGAPEPAAAPLSMAPQLGSASRSAASQSRSAAVPSARVSRAGAARQGAAAAPAAQSAALTAAAAKREAAEQAAAQKAAAENAAAQKAAAEKAAQAERAAAEKAAAKQAAAASRAAEKAAAAAQAAAEKVAAQLEAEVAAAAHAAAQAAAERAAARAAAAKEAAAKEAAAAKQAAAKLKADAEEEAREAAEAALLAAAKAAAAQRAEEQAALEEAAAQPAREARAEAERAVLQRASAALTAAEEAAAAALVLAQQTEVAEREVASQTALDEAAAAQEAADAEATAVPSLEATAALTDAPACAAEEAPLPPPPPQPQQHADSAEDAAAPDAPDMPPLAEASDDGAAGSEPSAVKPARARGARLKEKLAAGWSLTSGAVSSAAAGVAAGVSGIASALQAARGEADAPEEVKDEKDKKKLSKHELRQANKEADAKARAEQRARDVAAAQERAKAGAALREAQAAREEARRVKQFAAVKEARDAGEEATAVSRTYTAYKYAARKVPDTQALLASARESMVSIDAAADAYTAAAAKMDAASEARRQERLSDETLAAQREELEEAKAVAREAVVALSATARGTNRGARSPVAKRQAIEQRAAADARVASLQASLRAAQDAELAHTEAKTAHAAARAAFLVATSALVRDQPTQQQFPSRLDTTMPRMASGQTTLTEQRATAYAVGITKREKKLAADIAALPLARLAYEDALRDMQPAAVENTAAWAGIGTAPSPDGWSASQQSWRYDDAPLSKRMRFKDSDVVTPLLRRLHAMGCCVWPAAHPAAAAGNIGMLDVLWSLAATPEERDALLAVRDADEATPLLTALRAGHADVARWLLRHGCDAAPSMAAAVDVLGRGALHLALEFVNAEGAAGPLCEALLDAGANPLLVDDAQTAALHAAATALCLPAVRGIIAAAGDLAPLQLTRSDGNERTPLHCALAAAAATPPPDAVRVVSVLSALLDAPGGLAALIVADANGARPLHALTMAQLPPAVCAPLLAALRLVSAVPPPARERVVAGVEAPWLTRALAGCALHLLAAAPRCRELDAALELPGAAHTAALRTPDGATALHVASSWHIAERLLAIYPAGINAPDAAGRTPLWVHCASDAAEIVDTLLAAGASLQLPDGRTPYAVAGPRCVPLLRRAARKAEQGRAERLKKLQERAGDARETPLADEEEADDEASLAAAVARAIARAAAARSISSVASPAPHAGAATAAAAAPPQEAALPPSQLELSFDECAQEVLLSREARAALFGTGVPQRSAAQSALRALAAGDADALHARDDDGSALHTLVAGGVGIVYENALCASQRSAAGVYARCVRVWALVPRDAPPGALEDALAAAHRELRAGAAATISVEVVPAEEGDGGAFVRRGAPGAQPAASRAAARRVTPPADTCSGDDVLLRHFTVLSDDLAAAALSGASADGLEWPLHLDADEAALVCKLFDDVPTLLLGRSGTGKTTVALQRMWRLYRHDGVRRFAFVTASAELRDRVRALFRRLRAGAGETLDADDAAGNTTPASLADCPDSAWPLFLTSADWMRLADGATADPYFRRAPDGRLKAPHEAPATWRDAAAAAAAAAARRPDVDAAIFRARFWPSLLAYAATHLPALKRELSDGSASAVWREIVSFIKGRPPALPAGTRDAALHELQQLVGKPLSRAAYVALPHKVAPAFAGDVRREGVYTLFERYETLKRSAKPLPMYDACDIALHVARQHAVSRPAPLLDALFIDEASACVWPCTCALGC
jgi:hypothetical protein